MIFFYLLRYVHVCDAEKVYVSNCISVHGFYNLRSVYARGFDTGKSRIYYDLYAVLFPEKCLYTQVFLGKLLEQGPLGSILVISFCYLCKISSF